MADGAESLLTILNGKEGKEIASLLNTQRKLSH